MSLKPIEPRSIASQLVWLFSLAAALLLFSGLAVLYWIVVRHAFEEDNEVLTDKVAALRADISRAGGPQGLAGQLTGPFRGERVAYWVRLIDQTGATAVETDGMREILPPELFPRASAEAGSLSEGSNVHAGGKLFSLIATTQELPGARYTLQVAQDRSLDATFMKEFGVLLAAVLAIGSLAAALIAITVTRRGLRPLAAMTRALQRTGPHHLTERLHTTSWPRELQPLAQGFDEMLERLDDSFTRLSQFSADLAHELRTPIANIRGEAEVALTRARSAEEYRDVIESTVAECERLSAMIESLLFLARAEAADRTVARTRFDGRPAIEKIASYYEALAEERGVTISCEGAGEVIADEMLFTRAVSNLVANALRFTPAGGAVRITIGKTPSCTEIAVADTGCGIEARHLPRVFDRFYRVDESRSSGGVGLGLALVKSIVELHGGLARINSDAGRGTAVMLAFPYEMPNCAPNPEAASASRH